MKYDDALFFALDICRQIDPYVTRFQIAGSVRREKAEVGDIEIVAIPKLKTVRDMFQVEVATDSLLDQVIPTLGTVIKNGPKYKQIDLGPIKLDLFLVTPPAQWGVILALRTGPADFSQALVTARNKHGLLPSHAKVEDGAVWSGGKIIPMPEETDFLKFCGFPGGIAANARQAFMEDRTVRYARA
jgi:DNA polymerase/3'-5' exonuclease PolX